MNIHEYQAKDLLREYGVPVPDGRLAQSTDHATSVAEELGGSRWVIKAQIHAGGRGKAGGVKVANTVDQIQQYANQILGKELITHQTGNKGRLVQRILVEQAHTIQRELYLALVIDRATQRITLVASDSGGMDIEEVSKQNPEKVIREAIDPAIGLLDFQSRKVATRIGLTGKLLPQAVKLFKKLYRCFRDKDVLMLEINPLAVVDGGDLMAIDAKINFDGNALYRRPDIADLRDFDEEDPKEVAASSHGLNYIALDGNVGCIVNGAGLAMATMDTIALHGGRPANFLDVGGGASPEKVANAFRIVLEDPNVKAILVNIFAGINRCDWIATGIVQAMREQDIKVPVIVRLAGTNVEQGQEILNESGLSFVMATKLDDAAREVVKFCNAGAT
ncbi:MAG: ADP-forming succinate--CoA ligase subunit beta [Gammaproteobacteria bacterium]|nr:MAG: ADP-forming succinate--CoA ligase subunit beta [Gammaproteobacteria bacterium]